jgi:hypothetical protein
MSDPEVVVRLLAAIDEREAAAREATKWSAPEWTTASSAVLDLGMDDLDGLIPVPASPISHHMQANDPASILRLCQSHRDIVARYRHARRRSTTAPEAERLQWHVRTIALIDVMDILARGYGIEDGETT